MRRLLLFAWTVACVLASAADAAHAQPASPSLDAADERQDVGIDDAQPLPPRVELTLIGPNPSYVGQLVELELTLLRDQRSADGPAPFFAEPRAGGAIALLSTNTPPPGVRTQDGVSWLAQKRRYLVFPQTDGRVTVAPIEVRLASEDGKDTVLRTEPVELHADTPQGTGARAPLVARDVRIERTVEGALDSLRVGDAFTVRVRVRAEQTDAVMLPVTDLPRLEGLSRYPAESRAQSKAERGQYSAERVDTVTYVADTWGRYTLPRESIFWLDPQTGRYHEAVAPTLSFRARVNPSLGAGCVGGPAALARWVGWLFALVAALLLARRGLAHLRTERAKWARVPHSSGERAAFAAVERAARSGRDGATLTALYRWLRFALGGLPTLARLRRAVTDAELQAATEALEARVSGGATTGRASDVLPPLRRLRRSSRRTPHGAALPGLNQPRSSR